MREKNERGNARQTMFALNDKGRGNLLSCGPRGILLKMQLVASSTHTHIQKTGAEKVLIVLSSAFVTVTVLHFDVLNTATSAAYICKGYSFGFILSI